MENEEFLTALAVEIKAFLIATAVLELEGKELVKDAKLSEFIEYSFGEEFYDRLRGL